MTKYNRGNIIIVEVKFSDGSGCKLRPALIISDSLYNKSRDEVIVSGITSNVERSYIGDTEITGWQKAGLKVPSLATAIIQTVKKKLIRKQLGAIDKKEFAEIEKNIAEALGFSVR
jgi:mRNA-degrading endonuclease toxin of MazEF toxin-antitoxin module